MKLKLVFYILNIFENMILNFNPSLCIIQNEY